MRTVFLMCSAAWFLAGQTAVSPRFEVASLKPSLPPKGIMPPLPQERGGPGTNEPTRLMIRDMSMSFLVTEAYSVLSLDVVGPAWAKVEYPMSTDNFDIDAILPAGASKADYRSMMQNLLAERFGLKVHREKKEAPAYALVVAKGGLKTKESPPLPAGVEGGEGLAIGKPGKRGEDGFPVTPPGYSGFFVHVTAGHTREKHIRSSMDQFARGTRGATNRPGIDRTGLTGVYDFYLDYGNDIGGSTNTGGQSVTPLDQGQGFFQAIESQLGLRLVPATTEIDLLVIDHIERTPLDN